MTARFPTARRVIRYRALEGMNAVTRDEAEKALRAYFGNVSEIHFVQESSVPIEVYEFGLTAGGYSMSAAVTKQGGQVLYALSDADVFETNMTAEQLLDTARAFLLARGYGAMEMRYYSRMREFLPSIMPRCRMEFCCIRIL